MSMEERHSRSKRYKTTSATTSTTISTSTTTGFSETTSQDLTTSVVENIVQELTTTLVEEVTATTTELFSEAREDTTTIAPIPSFNMTETVPIYSVKASAAPGSYASSLLNELNPSPPDASLLYGPQVEDEDYSTSGAASSTSTDWASVGIVMVGSYFTLVGANKVINKIYHTACYKSDPRLIALGHRDNTYSTRLWEWTSTILEHAWIPLWFTNKRLREDAVSKALDEVNQARQTRNRGYLQPEFSDCDTDFEDFCESELAWLDDMSKSLKRQLSERRFEIFQILSKFS